MNARRMTDEQVAAEVREAGGQALAIEGEPGIEPGSTEPVTVLGKLDGETLEVVDLSRA